MIIGVSGVAVALTVGAVVLYGTLTVAVTRSLDSGARATAAEVSALAEEGALPNPLPVSGAQSVQAVDEQHRVVAASVNADRLTPLLRPGELPSALSGQAITVDGDRLGITGQLRVVTDRAETPSGPVVVIVAVQLADLHRSQEVLRHSLVIIFPLLLVVLALIAWRVIGQTLRPVEELRAGAERISGTGDDDRLPVPASADEIRALAVTLNSMLDRLGDARRRQRDFVADAAHELRSPLASLRMQLDVAQHLHENGSLPADLLVDVNRLTRLVEDLLLLARSDAHGRTTQPVEEAFALRELLAEVVGRYASASVEVRLVPGDEATVTASPEEIRRAVTNLVDNGVRHAASHVEVSTESYDTDGVPGWMIVVTDDGPGISPEDRERVFERFTRLDEARDRDAGGSGLGLAIARELVRRSGGTLTLDDADPGVRAEIRLPTGANVP